MRFLEMNNITKTYEKATVPCVKNMDLEMEEGEIVVILGPSGCGKTTVLKMIAGLVTQDSGTISIDGETVDKIPANKRPIAMVFQKSLLFRNMTVEQNVNYAPRVKQTLKKGELTEETNRLLKLVELEGYNERKATQLSGGQEQRVSLARALMTKPKLLLLDEPFSALDAELRVTMRSSVRKICKDLGQSMIFVTHDQQEAVAMADRIAVMMDSTIVQFGIPEDFYSRPRTKAVASFFGWKNFIRAHRENGILRSSLGDMRIDGCDDDDVIICIRPEAASISETGKYAGTVKSAKYAGTRSEYEMDVSGCMLLLEVPTRHMFLEGEEIRFDLDERMMWTVPEAVDVPPEIPMGTEHSRFGFLTRKKKKENCDADKV